MELKHYTDKMLRLRVCYRWYSGDFVSKINDISCRNSNCNETILLFYCVFVKSVSKFGNINLKGGKNLKKSLSEICIIKKHYLTLLSI